MFLPKRMGGNDIPQEESVVVPLDTKKIWSHFPHARFLIRLLEAHVQVSVTGMGQYPRRQ